MFVWFRPLSPLLLIGCLVAVPPLSWADEPNASDSADTFQGNETTVPSDVAEVENQKAPEDAAHSVAESEHPTEQERGTAEGDGAEQDAEQTDPSPSDLPLPEVEENGRGDELRQTPEASGERAEDAVGHDAAGEEDVPTPSSEEVKEEEAHDDEKDEEERKREAEREREAQQREAERRERQRRAKLAFLDPRDAGEDYQYQGEFIGDLYFEDGSRGLVGLQVVSLGDGEFEGVVYRGGLPGAGWDRELRWRLNGQREGDEVLISSPSGSAQIGTDHADVYSYDGIHVARLRRIHRISPTMGARPPAGALVLFDGSSTEYWEGAEITEDGLLKVGVTTRMPVRDFRMHLEFRTPYMPYARGQGRGNSGVYIQRRYEVQILDSFGKDRADNECGSLYAQRKPDVNMSLPPLRWQTLDIDFTAARFDDEGNKVANARITVLHNGEPIHQDVEITDKTGAGRPEGSQPLPIYLQDHGGDPVMFRNIWMVPRGPQSQEQLAGL